LKSAQNCRPSAEYSRLSAACRRLARRQIEFKLKSGCWNQHETDFQVESLNNMADAKLLKDIAYATDHKLPCPPIPFSTLGQFALNGWIQNVGDGADDFVITSAGRTALLEFRQPGGH
jgi:hypothetical protein